MTANVNVTKLLFKRGNTVQNANYTGINGEITVDTQAKTLRIHDGVTAGGNVITAGGVVGSYGNANVKSYLASFDGNINPSANVTYSLGSATQQWKDIWVSNATIYFNSVPLSTDATGNITYNGNPLVRFVDGNLSVGDTVVSGGGGNPFDQDLNANSAVTFYTVGATVINVSQINGTNPGDELVIQANNHNWTFGTDGNLTLPSGGDIVNSSGESVLGGGGNIAGLTSTVGNQAASHGSTVYTLTLNSNNNDNPAIRVYKGTNDENSAISIGQSNSGFRQANVIAIGNDDVGYDALPGGVYIGYQAGWNDTEDAQGLHAIAIGSKAAYYFATNNSITLNATGSELNPDESGLFIKPIRAEEYDDAILYYNTTSGEVTYAANPGSGALIGNTAPTAVNGRLWYNTEDGRTYVYALDTWIDASPPVVPGNMVGYGQDGNITLNEDARINYANGASIINSVYGDSQVADFLDAYTGNIAKIGATPLSIAAASVRLTSDNETWTFAPDGVVTLPNGMTIESYGTLGVNASIDIGGDDTRIRIDDNGAPPGFSITANATGGMASRTWLFGPDGNISFPDGSTQTTAYTGGGGGTGNALVNGGYTVALEANGVLTIGANATISNDGAEFRLWATDTDITVYRNGQDGYGVKSGNIEVYTDNGLRTLTNSNGFELKTGNIIIPNDKGVVFANGVNILSTIVGITSINTSVTTSTINDESGDFSYGSLSYDYAVNGVTSGGFTIDYSAPLVHGNVDVNVGNVIATNVSVSGNLTVDNTLVNRVYLLEAYANVTYTLPGSFAEDPCRYSVVSSNVNVPSAWFNTSTYTFTPLKAGYWEITAAYDVYRNGEASMAIKKNNSIVAAAGSFNAVAQQVTKIIYLNGSTDYINIINVGGAALSRSQYDGRSWFQARWVGA